MPEAELELVLAAGKQPAAVHTAAHTGSTAGHTAERMGWLAQPLPHCCPAEPQLQQQLPVAQQQPADANRHKLRSGY